MSKVTELCGRMESFVFYNLCPCSLSNETQQTYVPALLNGTGPSKRLPGILLSGFGAWSNCQCCTKERWEDLIQLCRHGCRIFSSAMLSGLCWLFFEITPVGFLLLSSGETALHNLMDHLIRKELAVLRLPVLAMVTLWRRRIGKRGLVFGGERGCFVGTASSYFLSCFDKLNLVLSSAK